MAANIIEINTNSLRSDVAAIEGEIAGINRCAERLTQTLHELESMWEGNAKKVFSAQVSQDIRQIQELAKLIEKFTEKTSSAHQEYDRCEGAVEQIISSIRV